MPDALLALGHERTADGIARALHAGQDVVVLQGPPGAGKSWLAWNGIGAMWEASGGSTVIAQGDEQRSGTRMYPFGFPMSGLADELRHGLPSLAQVTKAGEAVLGTRGVITATVQALSRLRPSARQGRALQMTEEEQSILHKLEALGRGRPLLFIADNLHWWDGASLEFLSRLRTERMAQAFAFLQGLRIMAVETPEPYQRVVDPRARDAFLMPTSTRLFPLRRPPREGFEHVLEALGAGSLPAPDVTDAIHKLSGGHLALARRCAERLAAGEARSLMAAVDADDFLYKVLVERLRSLGEPGRQALTLLQVAAVLGLTFREEELVCATGGDDTSTRTLLRYCRDEDVVEMSDRVGRFVHDLYRQYFLETGDRASIHDRLSDCLRTLRPGEYDLRSLNAIGAERLEEAGVLGVQAALQHQRDGRPRRELPPQILDAIDRSDLRDVAEMFVAALEHHNQYRFQECIDALAHLPHRLPEALVAERDFLHASCLMSTRSGADRAEARAMLEAWEGLEERERELGIRLMQLLLFGLSMLPDKAEGRVLEARVKRVLRGRTGYDVAAEDAMYTLDRCAGRLYPVDVCVVRYAEAAAHFAPAPGQTVVRRPVEYFLCLVNLGAALLACGRYEDVLEVDADIQRLVDGFATGTFPRLDYPAMNALLATYRTGAIDAAAAALRQREIATWHGVAGDPFYVENALAVYLSLAGSHRQALEIYDRLLGLLAARADPEPSMLYLIRANRCCARFVAGAAPADVLEEWAGLDAVVRRIPYLIRPILIRRHELLAQVMRDPAGMSPLEFDACLLAEGAAEFGPLWDQMGRGFRMPEIEWWR